jgi:carbonic anhydrase/acetyltransferase-like protein (isoleucine patch superfamily)
VNVFKNFNSFINKFKLLTARSTNQNSGVNQESVSEENLQEEQNINENVQDNEEQNLAKIYRDSNVGDNVEYFEKLTKHRAIYRVFDLAPLHGHCFIAPNATVLGEVEVNDFASIGFNTVIRGDINRITIGMLTSVGDHCVINTINSLPTGMPSTVFIGESVNIQSRVSITSSFIEDDVFIGQGSVILEGCRIEQGAVILPNSVVPPGRIIPAHQIWGGNPVRYVRNLKPGEVYSNFANSYRLWEVGKMHLDTYEPYNYAYLDVDSHREDVDLSPEMVETQIGKFNPESRNVANPTEKSYLH